MVLQKRLYWASFVGVMGCGAAEATGLGFVCFIVLNPRILSANGVDLGFFCFINGPISPPPPSLLRHTFDGHSDRINDIHFLNQQCGSWA